MKAIITARKNNMSPIYEKLRTTARQVCRAWGSDIEIDIAAIKDCIKTGKRSGVPCNKFVLGYRDCGVDGSGYIHIRDINYPYKICMIVDMSRDDVTLYEATREETRRIADELEKPYDEWLEYRERCRNYKEEYLNYAEWFYERGVLV